MDAMLTVRKLARTERDVAVALALRVFQAFEAPDYSAEGAATFSGSLHDERYLSALCLYGAFLGEELAGMLATRSGGTHIALFFVEGRYHGRGIGRALLEAARRDCPGGRLTVHAAPFAVPIYHHLGFHDTDAERTEHGLRFTPMALEAE